MWRANHIPPSALVIGLLAAPGTASHAAAGERSQQTEAQCAPLLVYEVDGSGPLGQHRGRQIERVGDLAQLLVSS